MCPDLDAEVDNRCDACPIHQLNRCFDSDKGKRILAANEMLVLMDAGFSINWDEIPADLALAVAIVKGERQKLNIETREASAPPAAVPVK